jgi:glucosamine--fructose-6-phosphate aminotransferase (isomerizing)
MDFFDALAEQPERLASSGKAVRERLAELPLDPWRSGTLATVAIGASSHAAHAFTARLVRGGRRAIALDAAELFDPSTAFLADCYAIVSEGGRSRETLEAAAAVAGRPRLGLTNDPGSPLAEGVEEVLGLDHGPDSPVYVVGYTAALQAFGLLAEALDGRDEGDDWAALPDQVATVQAASRSAAEQAAAALAGVVAIDVVAPAAFRATAAEGALLLREATRTPAASFETYQYLHGPMEPQGPGTGCVVIGDDRELELARYLADTGAPTVLLTSRPVDAAPGLVVIAVPELPALSRSILQVLPLQQLTGELARARGLRIGDFRYHQADTKVAPPTDDARS